METIHESVRRTAAAAQTLECYMLWRNNGQMRQDTTSTGLASKVYHYESVRK